MRKNWRTPSRLRRIWNRCCVNRVRWRAIGNRPPNLLRLLHLFLLSMAKRKKRRRWPARSAKLSRHWRKRSGWDWPPTPPSPATTIRWIGAKMAAPGMIPSRPKSINWPANGRTTPCSVPDGEDPPNNNSIRRSSIRIRPSIDRECWLLKPHRLLRLRCRPPAPCTLTLRHVRSHFRLWLWLRPLALGATCRNKFHLPNRAGSVRLLNPNCTTVKPGWPSAKWRRRALLRLLKMFPVIGWFRRPSRGGSTPCKSAITRRRPLPPLTRG